MQSLKLNPKFILFGIVILAAFLRLYRYDLPDVINDEVFYGYRSIGLIDSLNSPWQPTPFEWYEQIPWWAYLSFHDHPPLGFWLQHVFFKIFGVNLLGMRLIFILSGLASVVLVYFIGKRLFQSQKTGLLAAAILAGNNYHVFISRIGLQEGLVIFFLLLAVFFFLKTVIPSLSPPELRGEEAMPRSVRLRRTTTGEGIYFYLTVVAVALAILTKYTAVILLPIFFSYLLWQRRDLLTKKRLILSVLLLIVILSPVIVYNLKLYTARGHFDYQISYLLKQEVPDWQIRPGREAAGGFVERFQNLFLWFREGYGPLFSLASFLTIIFLIFRFSQARSWQFLGLSLLFLTLFLFGIGIEERFVAMLAPFLALALGGAFVRFIEGWKMGWVIFIIFLLGELFYTVNTYLLIKPKGGEDWHYSRLRRDSNIWGYNELEKFLNQEMKNYYPEKTFPLKFSFAKKLNKQAKEKAEKGGKKPRAILFVYDSTFYGASSLWYLTRRTVYEGWPIITERNYLDATGDDPDFFLQQGFKEIMFLKASDTLLRPDEDPSFGQVLEKKLLMQNIEYLPIQSPNGRLAFKIYKF